MDARPRGRSHPSTHPGAHDDHSPHPHHRRRRTAKVKLTDKAMHEYSAFINKPGLRQGRYYKVTIKLTGADGKQRSYAKRLYLHRSMNAPRP